ncbi:tripartite-type tricarboxylate transporter receptor subunit TctC [Variovorax boronicumulans]|uniref:Tripartite-type tricarboxylate transporter receptor subunit TctC n=1 Tax=Variovorax boronicumulans TaxID=436515 RepID=A0AAW8E0Q1_9BURK|nr:tripartite tricarboxylate transporter substrate binding protein [Variovorax boronicumulans]MDP9880154.1 tripartite-type tricarboxylate transporter receptor subunit TctC [Variovorax boronicumulans]MDP9914414.1 tripartite-type tricarboxylate transporter receptor subunit TctC [Variovorax boronicumulans]MDP9925122.1 tripartite-type tricarboxylate transporter receptor subunit TctC [Variovorax boronicumulans]
MKTQRLSRLLALAALFTAAGTATAETYPQRPVTLIVPYAAGGPTDQHLRAVADEAGKALGQPVVLDNRPGASGTNGAAALVRAAPDGYTLAVLPASVYREPFINKVAFDPARSFSYVVMLSDYTFGLAVKADAPWKTWQDFAADAARRPGKLNMVPFKGDAEVTNAILGGHIDAAPLSGVAVPHIDAGKMRYLVMLTPQRVKRYPQVPTLREQGVDAVIDSPYGIAGPAGMDPARVKTVHDAFRKALASPAGLRVLEQLNQQANAMDPEQYRRYALATTAREKERVARLRQRGLLD